MKILVTGANGYLGQGIVKQLLDDIVATVSNDEKLRIDFEYEKYKKIFDEEMANYKQ